MRYLVSGVGGEHTQLSETTLITSIFSFHCYHWVTDISASKPTPLVLKIVINSGNSLHGIAATNPLVFSTLLIKSTDLFKYFIIVQHCVCNPVL